MWRGNGKKLKVYIGDYENIEIEKQVLESIGAEVIGLHDNTEKILLEMTKDADAVEKAQSSRQIKQTEQTEGFTVHKRSERSSERPCSQR